MDIEFIFTVLLIILLLYGFASYINYLLKIITLGEPDLVIRRGFLDWIAMIVGGLFTIYTTYMFIDEANSVIMDLYDILSQIFSIIAGIEIFLTGLLQKRIYELGILTNTRYTQWEGINNFSFSGVSNDKLIIKLRKSKILGRSITINVPNDQKEDVAKLLTTRITY